MNETILDAVNNSSHNIEGFGACEGSMACGTCHCVLPEGLYAAQEASLGVEEEDLLDMREDTTPTSRLGCQLYFGPSLDGAVIELPEIVDLRS